MFMPLHNSMNQQLFKKLLRNQNNHYENTDDFCCERKSLRATIKSTQRRALASSLKMPKGTSRAKSMSNSEKIKLIASSYASLKASVSQSVENSVVTCYFSRSESLSFTCPIISEKIVASKFTLWGASTPSPSLL